MSVNPTAPSAVPPGLRTALPARTPADRFMRRLLFVPEGPRLANAESAQRMFGQSILISATRCLLTYIFLPIIAPIIGVATGIGPIVGIPLGALAMTFDVFAVRRFWLADHKYRWLCTFLYLVILSFLTFLLVKDTIALAHL